MTEVFICRLLRRVHTRRTRLLRFTLDGLGALGFDLVMAIKLELIALIRHSKSLVFFL